MRANTGNWLKDAPAPIVKFQELWADPTFSLMSSAAQAVAFRAGWLCFVIGEIPDDPFVVAQLTMGNAIEFEDHWPAVAKCFERTKEGNLVWEFWTERREIAFHRQQRARNAARLSNEVQRQKRAQGAS